MANLRYSSDILADALFRAGELTDGTSDFNSQALVYLNRAYRSIWQGGGEFDPQINEVWWWLKSEGSIILQTTIDTGTVNVSNNSTSVTFSSAPSNSVAGRFFKVDDHEDVFKIDTHSAGTDTATLDTVYTGDTDTAASYKLMQLEYDLADDVWKLVAPMRAYKDARFNVWGTSLIWMENQYPLSRVKTGVPEYFAPVDTNTVRFNRYGGDDLIRLDYDYLIRPDDLTDSDSEEPLVPLEYRHVLSDAVTYFLLRDKDDDKANSMVNQVRSGIKSMTRENRNRWALMGEPGQIIARPHQVFPWKNVPRTAGGLYLR